MRWFDRVLYTGGIYIAWLVSIVATSGSLYFSEVKGFVPCPLCWYQRILMYPLVFILGVASFRDDESVTTYAVSLTLPGMMIAAFHYAMQWIPDLGSGICSAGIPCSGRYINVLGFITIPFLSLTAFILITALLTRTRALRRDNQELAGEVN